jgi:nucleoside-diphosphate-sugar epimerase
VDVSSIAVYGWPCELPIDESRPYAPEGPYGESKVQAERMVRASGVPFTIVQPSITYGPGDTNGMIDKMFRMIARGRFIVPGLGATRVQLVFVDDLARIIVQAATTDVALGETFICTHRSPVQVGDLVQRMAGIVHRWIAPVGPPTTLLAVAALPFELVDALRRGSAEPPLTREKLRTISVDRAYSIDKMRRLMGTEPGTSLEEGLRRTAAALGLA